MKKLSAEPIFVLIFIVIFKVEAYNQKYEIDTSCMLLNAKILMLPLMNSIKATEDVCVFLEDSIDYKILESKGFASHIIFFQVTISWEGKSKFQFIYNGDLIFAYNARSSMTYRMKGFKESDFYRFFNDLPSNNINYLAASELDLKTKNRFTGAFAVEGLDMGCLFDSIKKHKKRLPCEEPLIRLDELKGCNLNEK